MRVCIIAEGCYPYVVGGVSSWINSMINSFKNVEFVVMAIITNRAAGGKFAYELPENVTEVYEAYLDDLDYGVKPKRGRRTRFTKKEKDAFRSLVIGRDVPWNIIFDYFEKKNPSVDDILMGADFLEIVRDCYKLRYPQIVFSDFLWTMRSIYLPLFLILKTKMPKADIYHCVATGYAGILGAKGSYANKAGMIVSEHGIYTREREEEILRSSWTKGIYKNIWMDQFQKMSLLSYNRADIVTCLFSNARELQVYLGCPREKIWVTPNGIDMDGFANLPGKSGDDLNYVDIGAVLRITPIKDVKTLIRAFAMAKQKDDKLRLWVMGPGDEDPVYSTECQELVDELKVSDIIFTGRVNVKEYLGKMDLTILTSISEGQPLTILESYAAHKPVISTDVGCCRELIYGNEDDELGEAGILTHIMSVSELSEAMVNMAQSPQMRQAMGECGYERARSGYTIKHMVDNYSKIYEKVGWKYGVTFKKDNDADDFDYDNAANGIDYAYTVGARGYKDTADDADTAEYEDFAYSAEDLME